MLKVKVCGLTCPENVAEIVAAGVDFVGFNFWAGSPRCLREEALQELSNATGDAKKVGVFVNEDLSRIVRLAAHLDILQLHGAETPDFCAEAAARTGLPVVKAFGVADKPIETEPYAACAGFLLDRASASYGGSGAAFDWTVLAEHSVASRVNAQPSLAPLRHSGPGLTKFFWLAGGIGPENAEAAVCAARRYGAEVIDINSKVEIRPGLKSVELVRQVLEVVKRDF